MTTNQFSYFLPPITNTTPSRTTTLEAVYRMITSGTLKEVTGQIRAGKCSKSEVLPFITPSGRFKHRKMSEFVSYSGIVSVDLDNIDTSIRSRLIADDFLRPSLIFVSPSSNGLKIFYSIVNASESDHLAYFKAIALYLQETYNLTVDKACKDISRCCFLCYDAQAYYSESVVDSFDLINYLLVHPASAAAVAPVKLAKKDANPYFATSPALNSNAESLNNNELVLTHAFQALRNNGWRSSGNRWTRPGKETGTSAIFNYFEKEFCFIFTNFSSNAFPFEVRGYSPLGVICLLEFGGDFSSCISAMNTLYFMGSA